MTATCLNLRELYGAKYRIDHEESHAADRGDHTRVDDPWTMIVLCEHGHVGAYGDSQLYASTNCSGSVATSLRRLDCCRVWMDGADGLNVVFDVADAKKVFAVMKPRRRRQVTEAERQRLAEMSARFSPMRKRPISESDSGVLALAQTVPDVQSHRERPEREFTPRQSTFLPQ